jgi:hypothetical protein
VWYCSFVFDVILLFRLRCDLLFCLRCDTSKANPEIWDAMRNPFWAKHINNSMLIRDLV